MSDVNTLFGMGGGSGVFVGGYTQGNSALPDIVIDGITVHIKTGVIALATAYPLAPTFNVAVGARWLPPHTPMPVSPNNGGGTVYSTRYTSARNGTTVLMFMQPTDLSIQDGNYYRSTDGGLTFVAQVSPVNTCNFRDLIFVPSLGLFFILVRNNGNNTSLWRSATGAAGSWVNCWGYSGTDVYTGMAFGNSRLVISGQSSSPIVVVAVNPTASVSVADFASYVVTGSALLNDSNGPIAPIPKIRFGKPGGATDSDKFFIVGANSGAVRYGFTATPENVATWGRLNGPANIGAGGAGGWTIQGAGSVWAIGVGSSNYLMNNLGTATIANGGGLGYLVANYDNGYFALASTSNSISTVMIYNASGALLSTTVSPFASAADVPFGALFYNDIAYLQSGNSVNTTKSIQGGNYTNTEKALYGPAYNAAGAFQADTRLFMRIA